MELDFPPSSADDPFDTDTANSQTRTSQRVSRRTQKHLHAVREVLQAWRVSTRRRDFPHAPFTAIVILPDPVLTTIASNRHLKTIADLRESLPTPWAMVEDYGQEVLNLVAHLDEEDCRRRELKKIADQETARPVNEQRVSSQRLKHAAMAKENIAIPGTGW